MGGCTPGHWGDHPREVSTCKRAGGLPPCATEPVGTFLEILQPWAPLYLLANCSLTHSFIAEEVISEHLQVTDVTAEIQSGSET